MQPLPQSSSDACAALVLNGALPEDRQVDAVAGRVAAELERLGVRARLVTLRDVPIAPCLGCFECWTRTPGECRTRDAGRDVARAFVRAYLVAYVTPVTFGGYSSELKKAIDRMICVELPFFTRVGDEIHHPPRYPRRPALLVVGVPRAPSPAEERVFHALARRNALNLQPPAFASHVVAPAEVGDGCGPRLREAIAGLVERSRAHLRGPTAAGRP